MKNIISFLLLLQCHVLTAQNVGIGITTPNSSALLDLTSINKGLLIPRMTGAQRTAIATPAIGLMVIQTNTETVPPSSPGLYLCEQVGAFPAWRRIARTDEITGGSSTWTVNGSNQFSNVAGNVGIGTAIPASKFHLVGNLLQDNGTITMNNAAAAVQLQNAGVNKGFLQLSGNNLTLGTNIDNDLGKVIFSMDGNNKVLIDSTGNTQILGEQALSLTQNGYLTLGANSSSNLVFDNHGLQARINGAANQLLLQTYGGDIGVGVLFPGEKLDIDGSIKLRSGSSDIKFETDQATGAFLKFSPGLVFNRTGTNTVLGTFEYIDTLGFSNFMRMRMEGNNSAGLIINTSNDVGVGTVDPRARLHVLGGNDETIRISSLTASIQFTDVLPLQNKKGFIDVSGTDFRIGTNSENNTGKFIVRVNGNNTINITPTTNNVGIGTETPIEKLHVAGNTFVSGYAIIGGIANIGGNTAIAGDLTINTVNPIIQLNNSGVAKGFVQLSGDNIRVGTNSGNAAGKFVIRTNGGDRFFVDGSGNVNIGSQTDAPGYILRVGGKMICEEVKVKLQSSGWPDYVFSEKYKLPTLTELNDFIKTNKHLPNIPSAAEVEKNGLEVGDMQKRMMEKIEELTLYIIDLKKEIDAIKKSAN